MSKKTFRMPDLSNATPTFLVDELGGVREQIKELQKLEGFYKEALQARSGGKTTIEGETFVALLTDQTQQRIDTKGLKEEFGEEWYQDHTKTIEFKKIQTTRLDA